ncbi:MAG: hypothetical protein MRY83_13040 [Flavobacteriales bacterium]|nr:hypothetical protein [Flavobacteriales bacterium]
MDVKKFEELGGKFISKPKEITTKLKSIKALVFDWDGVFNNGTKNHLFGSTFSEPDSMGLNMMRFHFWLEGSKNLKTYIVTGEHNPIAVNFAEREHLDCIFLGVKKKAEAIGEIATDLKITTEEIIFVYDDILDLSASEICGLNFNVCRTASPLLEEYIVKNKLADYITAHQGGNNAVREISEVILALSDTFDTVIENRVKYSKSYADYISQRNEIKTETSKKFSSRSIKRVGF